MDLDLTEAVEAAARTYWENRSGITWDVAKELNPAAAHDTRQLVLPIVDVIAPLIAAQVLRDAASAVGTHDEGDVHLWTRDADTWLMARAAHIEGGL